MKKYIIVLSLLVVFFTTPNVFADSVDVSASLNKVFNFSLNIVPEIGGDVAVITEFALHSYKDMVDSKGDMSNPGDYETIESGANHSILGLGYRVKDVMTPWVAISKYSIKTTKYEMKIEDSKLKKTTTDISEPISGVAFGLSAEHWVDRLGLTGIVAKVPEGVVLNARLKYKVTDIGTAHIGYSYNSYFGNSIIAGLGVAY